MKPDDERRLRVSTRDQAPKKEAETKPNVLFLCHGNVLRSQWAEFLLEIFGINASSAALADVTTQSYQGEVPPHILILLKRWFGEVGPVWGKKIKEVTRDIVDNATHIIIFADEKYLKDYPFIDPNDPRVTLIKTVDPYGNIAGYETVMADIASKLFAFLGQREEFSAYELPSPSETHGGFSAVVSAIFEKVQTWREKTGNMMRSADAYSAFSVPSIWSLLRDALVWTAMHRERSFPHPFYNFYPSAQECQEIITSIEVSDGNQARHIFSRLLERLHTRQSFIQNGGWPNDEHTLEEVEALNRMLIVYAEYEQLLTPLTDA